MVSLCQLCNTRKNWKVKARLHVYLKAWIEHYVPCRLASMRNVTVCKNMLFCTVCYGVRIGPSRSFVISHLPCFALSLLRIALSLFRTFAVSHFRCFVVSFCFAVSYFRCFALSQSRTFVVSYFRCFALSLFRTFVVSLFRCFVVSQFRCFVLSLFRCLALSQFCTFVVSYFCSFTLSLFRTLAVSQLVGEFMPSKIQRFISYSLSVRASKSILKAHVTNNAKLRQNA